MIVRRTFIKAASLAAVAATTSGIPMRQICDLQVPNSIGTAPPKLKAPPNACDCHHHIYDPARFPFAPQPGRYPPPSNGTVSDYRMLQKRIGTNRSIIVQQRNNAVDNRVTLDAIAQLEPNSRGIAVLRPTVSDAELSGLDDGGIRGIRFTLGDPATAVVTADMIEPLAKRIAGLGWHIQLF